MRGRPTLLELHSLSVVTRDLDTMLDALAAPLGAALGLHHKTLGLLGTLENGVASLDCVLHLRSANVTNGPINDGAVLERLADDLVVLPEEHVLVGGRINGIALGSECRCALRHTWQHELTGFE